MGREILIQEEHLGNPWRMMVCCICLNQTNNKQVRPILEALFSIIPDPVSAISCERERISECLKSTGFQNIKAHRIREFSIAWEIGIRDPKKFPGIGEYGREAWRIFVEEDLDFTPKDKKLKMYLDCM